MEIIPLINLKRRKIIEPKHASNLSLKKILERYKNKKLYILDYDGLEKNKPNLCLYQKLSKYHEIWAITAGTGYIHRPSALVETRLGRYKH